MRHNPKKIIIIAICAIFLSFLLFYIGNNYVLTNNKFGEWNINIIDAETKNKIDNASIVISDINKKYTVKDGSISIKLPARPSTKRHKNLYPYGYTLLTYSEGYLPRIDHNISAGNELKTTITVELHKPKSFDNTMYTEEFHTSSPTAVADFIQYYSK